MTVVQSSKATTFAVPENLPPSEFLNLPVEAEDDSVSLVSASTAFNNDTSLRLPSLADLGPDGDYFECPICFTLQSFRMEKSWKYVEAEKNEQLAIFAVPRTVDDDEEHSHGAIETNSEAVSSKDDNSQGHHIGESHPQELAPNCIRLSGLPPSVRKADIYNHLRAKEFRQFDVLKIENNAGFINFGHPGDAYRAVANLNGSIFMGAPLAVQFATLSLDHDGKVYVVEESHLDNFDPFRAIDEVNAAESHFRTTLLPMCEEFTANPPSDPQQRQDQSTHIVTMIRQEVWSTVNFIEAHNDEEVMARKTEVLEATGLDMALSFQDATDLDKIWKVIDAVQRDVTEADLTEEASKATNIDDISIYPSRFRQDIIDTTRARQHESSEEDRRPEEERKHHTQVPLPNYQESSDSSDDDFLDGFGHIHDIAKPDAETRTHQEEDRVSQQEQGPRQEPC
ncbi:hypothetical protein SLS63_005195 [Diaporthe eres]|uniref:RRM domain-containing protein n=1 Tax=Diaporthe eres TaxID=83184 RepID=A0ABR1PBP3_DIAER